MSDSIYAPPEAEISAPAGTGPRYYVVSTGKFMLLSILTMGLYFLYWMYKNWEQIKQQDNNSSWPIARAIFMIFWTHSLLNDVDAKLKSEDKDHSWSPVAIATTFVVLAVVSSVAGQVLTYFTGSLLPPFGYTVASLFIPVAYAFIMRPAQHAINIASGDEDGASNANLTAANWIWMVIGAIFWISNFFGLYALYTFGI